MSAQSAFDTDARLARLEQRASSKDQKLVELETTDLIVKHLLWRVGLPTLAILLAVAFYTGNKVSDIYDLAANAHRVVDPIIANAKREANDAKQTADQALATSKEVHELADSAKSKVASLKVSVERQDVSVAQIQQEVNFLQQSLSQQNNQVQSLTSKVQQVQADQSTQRVLREFPFLAGEHFVMSRGAVVDSRQKKPNELYVVMSVVELPSQPATFGGPAESWTASPQPLTAQAFANLRIKIQQQVNAVVFDGEVGLMSGNPSIGGRWLRELGNSCEDDLPPPCLIYFRPEIKDRVQELLPLVRAVQNIPDDRVRLMPVDSLSAPTPELLKMSGVDLEIILRH